MKKEQKALIRHRLEMALATWNDALLLRRQGGSPWGIATRVDAWMLAGLFYGLSGIRWGLLADLL